MKTIYTLLLIALLSIMSAHAQSPQSFHYQAVPRDANGNIMQNQNISLKMLILKGSSSGSIIYSETHNVLTNDQGLVNIQVGEGTVITGALSNIDWHTDSYFIRVEMDPTGGSQFVNLGTSELSSVPYALYANQAGNVFSGNYNDLTNKPNLSTVATSGSYSDLAGTPNLSAVATSGLYSDLSGTPSLSAVATSGNYNDLLSKPNLAAVATSGSYNDLSGTPVLSTVATSGSYSDLTGTPNLSNYLSFTNPAAGDIAYYNGSAWQLLPAGTNGQVLKTGSNNSLMWDSETGDNLGDHTATNDILMNTYHLAYDNTSNSPMIGFDIQSNKGTLSLASDSTEISGFTKFSEDVVIEDYNSLTTYAVNTVSLSIDGTTTDADDTDYRLDMNNTSTLKNLEIDNGDIIFSFLGPDTTYIGYGYVTQYTDPTMYSPRLMFDDQGNNLHFYGSDFENTYNEDIGSSGNPWDDVHADNVYTSSDRRLKENINALSYGLNEIEKLEPVSYKLKRDLDEEKTQTGLIAQDVKKIIPEIVKEFDYEYDEENKTYQKRSVDYLSIDYIALVPVLINGIKEQQQQIDKQNKTIDALSQKVKLLENRLNQIEDQLD